MARIYKPPPFSTVLDRSHPLTRGLIFATLFEGGPAIERVFGYPSTPTNSPQTLTIGEAGWGAGADFPAAGSTFHNFAGYTSDTAWLSGGISVFVKGVCRSFANFNAIIIKSSGNGGTDCPIEMRLASGTGTVSGFRRNAAGSADSVLGANASTGVVQDWGVTFPGANGIAPVAYLNGVGTAGSNTANFPYTGTNQPVWIGRRQDGGTQFNGVLLLLYVWSRQLSANEMLWMHQEPYAFWAPKRIPVTFKTSAAAPSAAVFRKSLSSVGTRVGSRQVQGG